MVKYVRLYGSLLGLLGNDSSLLDLDLLNVLSKTTLNDCDHIGLIRLEGIEVPTPS